MLTTELQTKIETAETITTLEDLYLPFRPKKRTRAIIAKERGLEPLADQLWLQEPTLDVRKAAEPFVDAAKEVKTVDEALAGARDIIAEKITEETGARAQMRAELYSGQRAS